MLQSFLFGGGVNPFMSRVAAFYLREHLAPHVAVLVDVYRAKRDAMLEGLWEVLKGTDVDISHPEGGFFIWIRLPSGTSHTRLMELAVQSAFSTVQALRSSSTAAAKGSSVSPSATNLPSAAARVRA